MNLPRLIPNWRRVLLYSYTFWAQLLGLVVMWAPELLFLWLGYDVAAPLLWFLLGTGLLIWGMVARVIRQRRVSG